MKRIAWLAGAAILSLLLIATSADAQTTKRRADCPWVTNGGRLPYEPPPGCIPHGWTVYVGTTAIVGASSLKGRRQRY